MVLKYASLRYTYSKQHKCTTKMMRVKRLDLHCTGINIETKWSLVVVILCVFHQN
jgi:hypothetical protein